LKLLVETLEPKDRVLLGTHNLESVDVAKKIILQRNIKDKRVLFGQLKGFSD
jgi:hypothetical protein